MAQDHAAPRVLFALPAVTGPVPGNRPVPPVTGPVTLSGAVTGNECGAAPDVAPQGTPGAVVPMKVTERAALAARHWAGTAAGELWLNPGRAAHALWHGKPESMAEHRAYIRSRAWVPPEMTGKPAAFIAWAGIAYHLIIARPVKAAARITDAASERPLRLLMAAVLISVLIFIVPF
jgi:hypothetical protein